MKNFKQLFCKHEYYLIENDYIKLGWEKCSKCGKEKYTGKNCEMSSFKFPDLPV